MDTQVVKAIHRRAARQLASSMGLVLVLLAPQAAQALLIDDFSSGPVQVHSAFAAAPAAASTASVPTALGASRRLEARFISGPSVGFVSAMSLPGFGDLLAYSSDADTVGGLAVTWDGNGGGLNGGAGLDLRESGTRDALALAFVGADTPAFAITLELWSGSASSSVLVLDAGSLLDTDGNGTVHVSFTEFLGIDFHAITRIQLELDVAAGGDLGLARFATDSLFSSTAATVAAPPMWTLGLIGLATLGLRSNPTRRAITRGRP